MESKNSPAPSKKRARGSTILVSGAAVVALGALIGWLFLNPSLTTDNAAVDRTKASLTTKMMGLIAHINAKEGDYVSRGALLVELDTAELQAQKAQAEANLAVVQESIQLSQVNMDKVQSDFQRAQAQYNQKIISTEVFEHAQKTFQSSQVDFTLAQKKVDIARAQLDLINATLSNARIVAPFDAVVAKKWMNEGDVLQPGQPVLTLFDSRSATVIANFEETKIARFRVGQNAEIRIDAYPGEVFHGTVAEVGTNTGNQFSLIPVNNAAGNFTKVTQRIPVKFNLSESTDLQKSANPKLLAGMSASVDVKAY